MENIICTWVNTENIFCKQVSSANLTAGSSVALLTPAAFGLFKSSYMRRRFFSSKENGGADLVVPNAMRRNSGTVVQIGIRLADVQLLRAECMARTGNIQGAADLLEAFRRTRMSITDAAVNMTDREELIRFIIDERTREFGINGFRWFDMRRLSTDPLFSATVYKRKHYTASGAVTEYTLQPERLTLRFTKKVLDANPGMLNNP